MKAIIIADDQKIIDTFSFCLEKAGYEIILYRWLLKALDNIEEISPDLVLINAAEYPRHWKTVAQYCSSTIITQHPIIIISVGYSFSEEEKEKAKVLHVRNFILHDTNSNILALQKILNEIPEKKIQTISDKEKRPLQQKPSNEKNITGNSRYTFLCTNPINGAFITGQVINFDWSSLSFIPDSISEIQGLTEGTILKYVTLKDKEKVVTVTACITDIKKIITLQIQEKV